MHSPYPIPHPEIPPLGTGLMPAKGPAGRLRDRSAAAVANAVFRSAMPTINQARAEVGLTPVHDLPDLMSRADRVLVCTSPSYDFAPGSVPANVCYVGPQLDDHPGEGSGGAWAGSPGLVLVGLSSTIMRQEGLLQRAADALGQLPVRGLITTGPAVDPAVISAPDNVTVTRWVSHADVLPYCSAVITHGGHGTVMKALIAGVPLVVVPLGRDQPGNAARVIRTGAGLRLRKNATVNALRAAVARVTEDPRYRAAARRMADRLAAERDDNRAIDVLEQVAAGGPAAGSPARR
jgi:MGT family glycosyltransferase